jgi:2-oxoisovalerate dehydrogenase E1 component alpha subunit
VFFCQNNQWAISEPNDRQTRIPLYQRAAGFGFPGVRVDGNDVIAVYAVTKAAMERARSGGGPTFVEAFTYRMGAHTTSDDPTRYRISAEVDVWKERDPIARLHAHLVAGGMADEDFFTALDAESDELAAHVRQGCLSMADPQPMDMFDHVYVDEHPLVVQERREFATYLDSFADTGQPDQLASRQGGR